MNDLQLDSIFDQYAKILKSIFLELLSKFIDDKNYCREALSIQNQSSNNKNNLFSPSKKIIFSSWYEIYLQICKKQKSKNLPNLAFNYCFEKAKDLYLKMKKLSRQKNLKFMHLARTIYKEFIFIEESNKKFNFQKIDNTPKEEKISLKNYLKQRTASTLSHTNTFNSTMSHNKFKHKILKETEEEKKEEKEKQKSNYIYKINKLNIYVGEYDYLINNNIVEKTKIYDGNLCATYLLKKEYEKNSTEGFDGNQRKEKVKGLLSNGKAIFIANDSSIPTNYENTFRKPFIKYSRRSRLLETKNLKNTNSKFSLREEILGEDQNVYTIPSKINSKSNSKYSYMVCPKLYLRNNKDILNKKTNISIMTLNNTKKDQTLNSYYKRESSETKDYQKADHKGIFNFNMNIEGFPNRNSYKNLLNHNNKFYSDNSANTIFRMEKDFNKSNEIECKDNSNSNKTPITAK